MELTIIDEFKMIKHKPEDFFVPGKVHSRFPLFEPFCTDHVGVYDVPNSKCWRDF